MIDFVIPWVDGQDEEWIKEKTKYQSNSADYDDRETRYRDWELLRFWFRSVECCAPWVHKIHFITWGHVPEWLNVNHPKINVVRHDEFIPTKYLPTFNSNTIECNIHRIKGLSKQFVLFNDDVFLNRKVEPTYFFQKGLPVDFFALAPICFGSNTVGRISANNISVINDHFNAKEVVKRNKSKIYNTKYGLKTNAKNLMYGGKEWIPGLGGLHLSNSFLLDTFETVWKKEEKLLDETCMSKFRSENNVNQWLFRYWQLMEGKFLPTSLNRGTYYNLQYDFDRLLESIQKSTDVEICANDSDDLENIAQKKKRLIEAFEKKYPKKSEFEKN